MTASGELRDHLASDAPHQLVIELDAAVGLVDVVQSTGIPHVEVGRIVLNGEETDWSSRGVDGDHIEVWPRCPLPTPESDPRFIFDVHLSKLARHLRLLGLDTEDPPHIDDAAIAESAAASGRILLSRDRLLLMRRVIERGRWIRATDPIEQAAEVLRAFNLAASVRPFTRCLECNGELQPADATKVDVPDRVRQRHTEFTQCPRCHRPYWKGTHHNNLKTTTAKILSAATHE